MSKIIYQFDSTLELNKINGQKILGVLLLTEKQQNLQSRILVNSIYRYFLMNEKVIYNNIFMVENDGRSESSSKLENLRILFNILIGQISYMEKELKRHSFEQKVIFDPYDKIFKFLSYLKFNNEERELIQNTYPDLYLWKTRIQFVENVLLKLKKNLFIEYKIEQIKEFINKIQFVE